MRALAPTIDAAIAAAQQVVRLTRSTREAPLLRLDELTGYADQLQGLFERIAPAAGLDPAKVQADLDARYSAPPGDALGMIAAGQQAGQVVVATVVATYSVVAAPRDKVFHADSARFVWRTVGAADLEDLHAAMDGLLAALAPIDPDG